VKICKNCGVELADDMLYCPLCGELSDEGALAHYEPATRHDSHPHPVLSGKKSVSPKSIVALIKRKFHV
jgi:uncharacterized membrane protein YvbJ